MHNAINIFFNNICTWATKNSTIEAIALVGSYARNAQNENSDIDLIIISTAPQKLIKNHDWLDIFGNYKNCQIELYGLITSIRVYYSFAEVEFGIGNLNWISAANNDKNTKQVVKSGFRILYDPKQLLNSINA